MALDYNKVTLYGGNQNGGNLYDYLWIKSGISSQEELDIINDYYYIPEWVDGTILLSPFTTGINGGNVTSLSGNITSYSIYRKRPNDTTLTFVANVPADQSTINDYNIRNEESYQYIIFPQTDTEVGQQFETTFLQANWNMWSLIGLEESSTENLYYADTTNIWLFRSNIQSSEMTQNLQTYTYENFTRFPKISVGDMNYITTSFSALIGSVQYINGTIKYVDTVEMRRNFNSFIANGKMKLLKDIKGSNFVGQTTGNNFSVDDKTYEQILRVSFDFTQLADSETVSVINDYN